MGPRLLHITKAAEYFFEFLGNKLSNKRKSYSNKKRQGCKIWVDVGDLKNFIDRKRSGEIFYETLDTFEGFFQNLLIDRQRYA